MNIQNIQYDASDPKSSAWVSANAGAGKTYVLITRLVHLLLVGTLPERLLCLTHTKTAATEMQKRLFDLLGEWVILSDKKLKKSIQKRIGILATQKQLERARTLFAKTLETPGGLKIQTIHAFCESLLRRFPLEAGVSSSFKIMDERQTITLNKKSLWKILSQRQKNKKSKGVKHLGLLTRLFSEKDFQCLADDIVKNRTLFFDSRKMNRECTLMNALKIEKNISSEFVMKKMVARLDKVFLKEMMPILKSSDKKNEQNIAEKFRKVFSFIEGKNSDIMDIWFELTSIFFTDNRPRKSLLTTGFKEKNPDIADKIKNLADNFLEAERKRRNILTYEVSLAIYGFSDILLDEISQEKRYWGFLDYDDLIEKTVHLLQQDTHEWVLYKLDGGIEHILVDEAQDTSPLQWRVIQSLAKEFFVGETAQDTVRTVFAVGDEKQSIFSFQGADPSQFDKMKLYFIDKVKQSEQRFNAVMLDMSWRSGVNILRFVDLICHRIQPSLTYKNQKVSHQGADDSKVCGYVELWDVESDKKQDNEESPFHLSAKQRVAQHIAQQIKTWQLDADCHFLPKDILILVQNRTGGFVQEMIRSLKKYDIPVAGADRMQLTEQIAVMDLIAAGNIALLPEDDLTFACYLRSPLGGLTEENLLRLCVERNHKTLFHSLRIMASQTSKPNCFSMALERVKDMLRHVDLLSPFEFYMRLLGVQKGRILLTERLGYEVDDPVDVFLNLILEYERTHIPSLQGFLYWIHSNNVEVKREMEETEGEVRIMTIHGAKGLEAPIVFLPDTCRPPQGSSNNKSALIMTEQGLPLWCASKKQLSSFSESLAQKDKKAVMAEHKRLFYVAITRAKTRLYMGGVVGARRKTFPENSWYDIAQDVMTKKGIKLKKKSHDIWYMGDINHGEAGEDKGDAKDDEDSFQIPEWLEKPAPKEGLLLEEQTISSLIQTPKTIQKEKGESFSNNLSRIQGILTHKLLEKLIHISPRDYADKIEKIVALYHHELPQETLDEIVEGVKKMLFHPHLVSWFEKGRSEMPIMGDVILPNGQSYRVSGRIDLYVETDEEVLILDYKTKHSILGVERNIPEEYMKQMALYHHLVSAVHPDKTIRCGIIWTQDATVSELSDADLKVAFKSFS